MWTFSTPSTALRLYTDKTVDSFGPQGQHLSDVVLFKESRSGGKTTLTGVDTWRMSLQGLDGDGFVLVCTLTPPVVLQSNN